MKTVFRREIAAYLESQQFAILFIISVLLFASAGIFSNYKYRKELARYDKCIASAHSRPSTLRINIYPRQSPLQFVADGNDGALPYRYILYPMGKTEPLHLEAKNKKMPEAPAIDWTLIIKILFSLYAILLGYNAVSGEKEEGTLALVFANPLGRIQFLLAKYAAIILTLFIPFLAGGLICLLIVGGQNPIIFHFPEFSRVLVFTLLAAVYISIFIMLSLFISILVKNSSISLFLLLAAWMLIVIILPNLSGILSERFVRTKSEYQIYQAINISVDRPYSIKILNEVKKMAEKGINSDKKIEERTNPLFHEGYQKHRDMEESFIAKIRRQSNVALGITRLSPAGLFQISAENLAKTGHAREDRFLEEVMNYSKTYDRYIIEKTGKLLPWLGYEISPGGVVNGKIKIIMPPSPPEYKGDMSDFPWFVEKGPSLGESLKSAFFDLAGLLVWNIVLTILAFGAFLKADVR